MAKQSNRWTKEDFENTFEEFLRTSLSSEEDTDKIKKLLETPVTKKSTGPPTLWWANDSDDDSLKKDKGKSFLKTKKSSESPARSKSGSERNGRNSSPKGKAITKSPTASSRQPVASPRKTRPKGKQESSSGKLRGSKSKIDTSMSKDSLEDISEKSEEHDHHHDFAKMFAKTDNIIAIQDSSIDTSASYEGIQSNKSKEAPGFDTLDEAADKQRFFQNLEKEADGTVDYGRLNQELSQTGTTMMSPGMRMGQADSSGVVVSEATPSKEMNLDTDSQKPSMLSKVALMDSLDSTLNTTTSPKVANSRDTTQENLGVTMPDSLKTAALSGQLGTNTSKEMEDLQRVLQEVGMSPTLYGGDSRPPTGKGGQRPTLTPTVPEKKEVDRSVGDIIREMDAIDRRGREIELEPDNVPLRSNYKSPRSPRSPSLHRQYNLEDGGFENSHTEDTEVYQPVTSVGNRWGRPIVKERKKVERKAEEKQARPSTVPNAGEKTRHSRDRYSHIQSSGYGRPTSPPSRPARSRSAGISPHKVQGRKTSPAAESPQSRSRKKDTSPQTQLRKILSQTTTRDPNMERSIEVFTRFISQQVAAKQEQLSRPDYSAMPGHEREAALIQELKEVREQLSNERTLKVKLQTDMHNQEQDFKRQLETQKLKYEDEVFTLKQENFVLSAKLKELEGDKEVRSRNSDGPSVQGSKEDEPDSRVSKLEREVQEQENLLAGYQAENKRLYEEMKAIQRQGKATESSMFKENQRLTAELANLKQELELKQTELQNKGIITSVAAQQQIAAGNMEAMMGVSRVAHLEGELAESKRIQENQNQEIRMFQQNKFEMEKQLEALNSQKDALMKELAESLKPEQVKDYEAKHKEEIDKLQRKIRWYAENQELLDKSNAKLRAKDDEIHRLKMRLEDFKSEAGRKLEENKIRAKEKAADAKKIQDLERQVKEMESVIRRRHPNSLPAMMMVAATVPDSALSDIGQGKGRSVQVLEARVEKLERELESRDELARQDVRAVEQKYNHVKLQYEERISELEKQLSLYQSGEKEGVSLKDHPHSHALALERELDRVKERGRKQVTEMQSELDRVTAELNKVRKNQENMMKNETRQFEAEWKNQVTALQREVKDREHDIKLLQNTLEKMRARAGKQKGKASAAEDKWPPHPNVPSNGSREYQPGDFADSEMSNLLQENHFLKAKVDQLQLELDEQRVDLRRSLAETEAVARQNTERLEHQIEVMRTSHQKDLQRILSDQALQSSSSKLAELQSKCDTQEVMVRHLQVQLKKAAVEAEQVPQLKSKISQLQKKLEETEDRLREARLQQTPEMRHFESLEDKLTDLVEKQRKREAELDSMVKQNQMASRTEMEEEVEKWKKVVDAKNQQLQVFRSELDSILEVLRALQRQGVTLPMGTLYS